MWFKKSRKDVDFGEHSRAPMVNVSIVDHETPFGMFQVRSDGTFVDVANRNQWIRAAWGMTWTGSSFAGKPHRFDWNTATELFGRGAVSFCMGSAIRGAALEKSEYRHGYKEGRNRVIFMGADDWRLPTAAEWETFHLSRDDFSQDGWGYDTDKKPVELRQTLFPFSTEFGLWAWSATQNGRGIAWAVDGKWPPGDHQTHLPGLVLLVRRYY
jgi:hypothetical protein